ncbi:putative membrane protein [Rhodopirellula maiorica SM1]|uniref:Putative membrane protein n=1 Tax=Rhodopirellula maiorica SM1 TaxID=1265738 RepID=M5RD98_9BACT|nr:hypothetical protein [Rhodopirellula maiorica]EMI17350.1 putative membrane protein [Rhodopirellula maiorica SM1]
MKDDSAAAHQDDPTPPIQDEPLTQDEQPILASLATPRDEPNRSSPACERPASERGANEQPANERAASEQAANEQAANAQAATGLDPAIRVGSPFAKEPEPAPQPVRPEDVYFQATPLRYTSIGSVAAASLVVLFALGGTVWFPAGGTLVAGLGCLLSIFGMYSHLRIAAASLLTVHLFLFVASYSRVFV